MNDTLGLMCTYLCCMFFSTCIIKWISQTSWRFLWSSPFLWTCPFLSDVVEQAFWTVRWFICSSNVSVLQLYNEKGCQCLFLSVFYLCIIIFMHTWMFCTTFYSLSYFFMLHVIPFRDHVWKSSFNWINRAGVEQ